MFVSCAMPRLRSNGCLGVGGVTAQPMSFDVIALHRAVSRSISLGIIRGQIFHGLLLVQIDSLEEMVLSCHMNIGHECSNHPFGGVAILRWWVDSSLSLIVWIDGRFHAQRDL